MQTMSRRAARVQARAPQPLPQPAAGRLRQRCGVPGEQCDVHRIALVTACPQSENRPSRLHAVWCRYSIQIEALYTGIGDAAVARRVGHTSLSTQGTYRRNKLRSGGMQLPAEAGAVSLGYPCEEPAEGAAHHRALSTAESAIGAAGLARIWAWYDLHT